MNLERKLQELKKRDHLAQEGGGAQRRERQHKEGKMSARERVEFLLAEETSADQMTSAIFWDGKKYRYQPLGAGLE